jgi:hypothetical protein
VLLLPIYSSSNVLPTTSPSTNLFIFSKALTRRALFLSTGLLAALSYLNGVVAIRIGNDPTADVVEAATAESIADMVAALSTIQITAANTEFEIFPQIGAIILARVQLIASDFGEAASQCNTIHTALAINDAALPESNCKTLAGEFAVGAPVSESFFKKATAEAPSELTSDKLLLKNAFKAFKAACDLSLSSFQSPPNLILADLCFRSWLSRTSRSTARVKLRLRKLARQPPTKARLRR